MPWRSSSVTRSAIMSHSELRTYPRVEPAGHDVGQRVVDRDLEPDLGILRGEPRQQRREHQIDGQRRDGEA